MEEHKVKSAFSAVKRDILFLKRELENIDARFKHTIKEEMNTLEKVTRDVKVLSEDNSHRISHLKNRDVVVKKESLPQEVIDDFLDIKQRVSKLESNSSSNDSIGELSELLQEKLDMELSGIKLQFQQDISDVYQRLGNHNNNDQSVTHDSIQRTLDDFSEMINEKMSMELNGLRLEMTQEIGNLYDKCFTEIVDLKQELKEVKKKQFQPKSLSTSKPKTTKQSNKKKNPSKKQNSSRLKKVANWFLEDEEQDLKSIKKEVKK